MNICNDCSSKYVCKIIDFVGENSKIATIEISSCTIKNDFNQLSSYTFDSIKTGITQDDIDKIKTQVDEYMPPKSYNNFRDESNKLEEGNIKKKNKKKIVSIIKEDLVEKKKIVLCPECNGATYEDDFGVCTSCGKDICSGCGVESLETKERFCNECWKEQ